MKTVLWVAFITAALASIGSFLLKDWTEGMAWSIVALHWGDKLELMGD